MLGKTLTRPSLFCFGYTIFLLKLHEKLSMFGHLKFPGHTGTV